MNLPTASSSLGAFSLARLPRIEFGSGSITKLPRILSSYGDKTLLITGATALCNSEIWPRLCATLSDQHISFEHIKISGEPSPQHIDAIVAEFASAQIAVVCAIGGGSVLDAGKAIAGLLRVGRPVADYLEGVGPELEYQGPAIPFIAVPTTAGTGSEATKNAVLSVTGENGYKKSFRHEDLVAQYALIDPDLLATCPPALIAANGMDALTQLLESYVSLKANAFADALALSGLESIRMGLLSWYQQRGDQTAARSHMAYAALLSGITLAQVGLGSVHGLASPLGAFFPIPHGVVCGTLVATATAVNIDALKSRAPHSPALVKYAQAGRILSGQIGLDDETARQCLLGLLEQWSTHMRLPTLDAYGVLKTHFSRIVANSRGSSMKTNPVELSDDEIGAILARRTVQTTLAVENDRC